MKIRGEGSFLVRSHAGIAANDIGRIPAIGKENAMKPLTSAALAVLTAQLLEAQSASSIYSATVAEKAAKTPEISTE
jgi:hypothetical protein